MLIAGLICLGLAAVAVGVWFYYRRLLQATQRTETLQCSQLTELSKAAAEAVGPGSFNQGCEVVGTAVGAEGGPLTGPESKQECVWHKTVLTEHYWDWETDSDGDRRRVERQREISSHTSETPFLVDDGSGRVSIDPRGATIDGEEKVVSRMERDPGRAQSSGILGLAQSVFEFGDRTIGIEHEEWIIRTGGRLYVLGEVTDRRGLLQLAKPDEGPMIISTRSEEEFAASSRKWVKWSLIAAAVLAPAGVVLTVLALVL